MKHIYRDAHEINDVYVINESVELHLTYFEQICRTIFAIIFDEMRQSKKYKKIKSLVYVYNAYKIWSDEVKLYIIALGL